MDQPINVDVNNIDLKSEAGLKYSIEEIKKAYRNKNFDRLELFYDKLVELKIEDIRAGANKPQQKLSQNFTKLLSLAENLAGYCVGAMYLFHHDSIKKNHDDKYGRATSSLEYVKFDDELFKHIEEVGITEKEQRLLMNFCQVGRDIRYGKNENEDKIDTNTVFCFKNKNVAEYLFKDPKVLEIFKNIKNIPIVAYNPEKGFVAYDSYLFFIKGYLYETGNKELNIDIDLNKAKECYEKSCETKREEQHHPGTLLLKAKELEANGKYTEALKLYDDLTQEKFPIFSNDCYSEHYYSANLAAGKLCRYCLFIETNVEIKYKYLERAENYLVKASQSPIKNERVEAVKELHFISIESDDQAMVKHYRERLENLGETWHWSKDYKEESSATIAASFHNNSTTRNSSSSTNSNNNAQENLQVSKESETPKYT